MISAVQSNGKSISPMLSEREKCLMPLLLGKTLTEEDMHILTDGFDMDESNQIYLLMLACVGCAQGWDLFPPEMIPRLKGIHRYHQVANTIRIPWLKTKIHTLNEAGIPVMLLKGLAHRYHYCVGMPRLMGDFDIAVPEDRYAEAIELLQDEKSEYRGRTSPHHGKIVCDRMTLEVHSWIFKNAGERGSDIWDRAVHFDLQGEEVCALCPEDMLIHLLDHWSRDYFTNTFLNRWMKFFFDALKICQYTGPLDLDSLAKRSAELHVLNRVHQALEMFAAEYPDVVNKEALEKAFPNTRKYQKWLKLCNEFKEMDATFPNYGYAVDGSLTEPKHFMRSLKKHILRYRYRYPDQKLGQGKYTIATYLREISRKKTNKEMIVFFAKRLSPFG